MDVGARQSGSREYAIRFRKKIVNLVVADANFVKIALVTNIGRPNQVQPVPRDNEERAAVGLSFHV